MTGGQAGAERHYPVSDTSLDCVCGWRPPSQERWRQQMRLNEHLRFMRLGGRGEA